MQNNNRLPKRFFSHSTCLQLTEERNTYGINTITVDLAPMVNGKADFGRKIQFQLSEAELNELGGVIFAMDKSKHFESGYHGSDKNKLLKISLVNEGINFFMLESAEKKLYTTLSYDRYFDVYITVLGAIARREQVSLRDIELSIHRINQGIAALTNGQ